MSQTELDKPWCGTKGISPWLKEYRAAKGLFSRKSDDTTWLYVPTTFHIVGTNAGTGYFELASAFRALCEMNAQFEEARIRYYLVPGEAVVYHNNTSWYAHEYDKGQELIETNRIPDRFNIFVVQNPAGACAYAWLDAVVMGKGCSGAGNSTWSHEAGHHFSLPHPFFGWEGYQHNYNTPAPEETNGHPVEKTDGSNCYQSGDYFCDTRPDYLNYRWSCNDQKVSTLLQRDPNGVAFRSDASLYMGYASDACASRFTDEQIAAMRENLRTEHASYAQISAPILQIPDDQVVQLASPIDSQIVLYDKVTLRWHPLPNASYYFAEVFFYSNMTTRLFSRMVHVDTAVQLPKIINNRAVFWRVRAFSEGDVCQPIDGEQKGVFLTRNIVAVNQLQQLLTATVTPNPADDIAQFLIQTDISMNALLRVTNTAGQTITEHSVSISEGDNLLDIPLENCVPGLYFVTLQNEKGSITQRMIKL